MYETLGHLLSLPAPWEDKYMYFRWFLDGKKRCVEHICVHNHLEASREGNLGSCDSCHRDSCFSSGLSGRRVTSWGHTGSPLSSPVKPAWLHTESMGASIRAHGGSRWAAWSSCQERAVKTRPSPPACDPRGQAWSRLSQHIPPRWQHPQDLAFTLLPVRFGVMYHLPKDGVEGLAASGKTLSKRRFLGQGVPAVSNSWADCESSLTVL